MSKSEKLKQTLLGTNDALSPLILRVILGLVILPHGAQKMLGWFGGYGFSGTMNYFTEVVHLPWLVGFLVIVLEFFGAFALIIGLGTRIIAFCYTILAIGIVLSSHIQNGFFMNWFGNQEGEGYEYFLLWIAIALSLILTGSGKYGLDRQLIKHT